MHCPKCGVQDVIEIEHRLPDGTEVHFYSCHKCEEKWWDKDGEHLPLAEVLDLARKRPS